MLCLIQALNPIMIKLSCFSQKLSDSDFSLNDHSLFSGVLYLCEQQPTSGKKGMPIKSGIPFLCNFFSAETNRTHQRANICPNGRLC